MSRVEVSETELKEVDICDHDSCWEVESGVFELATLHRWSSGGCPAAPAGSGGHCQCSCGDVALERSLSEFAVPVEVGDGSYQADRRASSIVDRLLVELYDTCSSSGRRGADSWDSSTEASGPEAVLSRSNTGSSFLQELQGKHTRRHQMSYLSQKDPEELKWIIQEVNYRIGIQSAKLVRQLRRKDRLHNKQQKKCDIVTACLQAVSQKRRVDTRLKFTLEPSLGKNGFQQWYDALKAVARLPTGIPKEWRRRVWLTLADQYLHSISIDWEKTMRFAFNERSNPDDDSLGIQIVKDLHRTGCSSYCGQEAEQDRVVLKRVLLAYARWNKTVGYCQGFNVLAALILEVTEGNEGDALKVMIYLIDKVLPDSYFANNLRALSVDMAVFRDLLRMKLPELSQHLHHLQKVANRTGGGSYEPPLTNVFTMQWFLTMFATCLPHHTVLKIWDSVFFEGSEVLLRVALAIWAKLGERIEECQTADEFYSTMGVLTQEMLEHSLIDSNELMQTVYSMADFPFPQLAELREKYTYNITPFPAPVKANGSQGLHGWESDDDGDLDDEDSIVTALGCLGPLGGLLAPEIQRYQKHLKEQRGELTSSSSNMAELSPGAVGAGRAEHQATMNSMMLERMSTDIRALTKQYSRIKRRQQQQAGLLYIHTDKCPATSVLASQVSHTSPVVNHLLLGRKPRAAQRPSRNGVFQAGSLPQAQSTPNLDHGARTRLQSPWRTHVRTHRRNLARARAQLGFDDSFTLDDTGSPEHQPETAEEQKPQNEEEINSTETVDAEEQDKEKKEKKEEEEEEEEEEEPVQDVTAEEDLEIHLQEDGCGEKADAGEAMQEMEERLSALELEPPGQDSSGSPAGSEDGESASDILQPKGQPESNLTLQSPLQLESVPQLQEFCSTRRTASDSSSSESGGSSLRRSPSKPQQIFSPFPCVKAPRKSAAARNLGLYGPTSRTPNVHFPHMSKTMNRLGASASASTRR
ncbi:TBC1 domain family member 30 isoform X2 [Salminus brasiliensis]|uniref:TBC1 domain family member 30 isoform X2 n=1 Tax=Salminus brasiliensis TaxID=930266 RepID=UPI003B83958B